MKKTSNPKQVSEKKKKYLTERRSFEDLPDLFIPFRFNIMHDYPLVVNHRLYKIRNTRAKRILKQR